MIVAPWLAGASSGLGNWWRYCRHKDRPDCPSHPANLWPRLTNTTFRRVTVGHQTVLQEPGQRPDGAGQLRHTHRRPQTATGREPAIGRLDPGLPPLVENCTPDSPTPGVNGHVVGSPRVTRLHIDVVIGPGSQDLRVGRVHRHRRLVLLVRGRKWRRCSRLSPRPRRQVGWATARPAGSRAKLTARIRAATRVVRMAPSRHGPDRIRRQRPPRPPSRRQPSSHTAPPAILTPHTPPEKIPYRHPTQRPPPPHPPANAHTPPTPTRQPAQAPPDHTRQQHLRKFEAARTVEAFSVRLRDEADLDALTAELLPAGIRPSSRRGHRCGIGHRAKDARLP